MNSSPASVLIRTLSCFAAGWESGTATTNGSRRTVSIQNDSLLKNEGDRSNPTLNGLSSSSSAPLLNATFEWVRLAQPIPVRIKLVDVSNETILSSGMTATVRIEPKHESEKEDQLVFSESRAGRP